MALGCDPVSLHGFQAHHTPQECLLPASLLAALPPFFLPRQWQSGEGPAGQIAGSQRPVHFGIRCSWSALLPCSTRRAFHHFRDTRNSVKARIRTSRKDSAGRSGCLGDCWARWGHERSGTTSRTGQAHTCPGPDEECTRETWSTAGGEEGAVEDGLLRGTFTHTTTYHVLPEALQLPYT